MCRNIWVLSHNGNHPIVPFLTSSVASKYGNNFCWEINFRMVYLKGRLWKNISYLAAFESLLVWYVFIQFFSRAIYKSWSIWKLTCVLHLWQCKFLKTKENMGHACLKDTSLSEFFFSTWTWFTKVIKKINFGFCFILCFYQRLMTLNGFNCHIFLEWLIILAIICVSWTTLLKLFLWKKYLLQSWVLIHECSSCVCFCRGCYPRLFFPFRLYSIVCNNWQALGGKLNRCYY